MPLFNANQEVKINKNVASGYVGLDSKRQAVLQRGTVASASTITLDALSGNILEVSGTTTVNTITAPDQSTYLILIPTGVFTITEAGNIRTKGGGQIDTVVNEPIFLTWNSTSSIWSQTNFLTTQSKQTITPTYGTDFIETSAAGLVPFTNSLTGSATTTYTKSVAGRVGIATLARGAVTATDRARFGLGNSGGNTTAISFGGEFGFVCNAAVRIPVLSDGTNRFTFHFGFNDLVTGEGTDVLYFKYSDNINSGRWQIISRKAGVTVQTIDTGVTVVAGDWYDLYIEVNKAGDRALFYINGTLVSTITTTANIPNGTAESTGVFANLLGVLGTGNVEVDIDYLMFDKI